MTDNKITAAPLEAAPAVLAVNDLTVKFKTEDGWVTAVDGISLTVHAGETVALVGESGSGKSVTSLSVMRLVEHGGGRIAGGSIELTDRAGRKHNLVRSTPGELRAMRGADMAMIFQEPMTSLNPVFTVGDQIAESLKLHRKLADRQISAATEPRAHSGSGERGGALPASVVGRHASARDDCDGFGVPAETSDRRRADDRSRRHGAGADSGAHPQAAGKDRHGRSLHHA